MAAEDLIEKKWVLKTQTIVQASFFVASSVMAAATYFHTQGTVNARVDAVEAEVGKVKDEANLNAQIMCQMAIDLKAKKAGAICTRTIFKDRPAQ
jgi:hypothetical protein